MGGSDGSRTNSVLKVTINYCDRAHAKDEVTVKGVTIEQVEEGNPRQVLSKKELKYDTIQREECPEVVQREKGDISQISLGVPVSKAKN
nr:hypothetical protein HmN_000944100 [Hymenolepis microstoma]